jgi:hypothetical protein
MKPGTGRAGAIVSATTSGRTALAGRSAGRRAARATPPARVAPASRAVPAGVAALAMLALVGAAGCGGAVRSPTEPAGGGVGAQAFTFTQIQAGIFTPSCAKSGCHASSAAAGGLVLEAGQSYGQIVGRPAQEQPQLDYVRPGNPEASYLLEKLRGDPNISGSRMPRDGPPFLSPQQIAGLAAWIQAGAPND